MARSLTRGVTSAVALLASLVFSVSPAPGAVTRVEVERAIRNGVAFLKHEQREDGSWIDVDSEANTGTTSLATLALLTAGEAVNSDAVSRALTFLRGFTAQELNNTYSVALQTMVFAAADPAGDRLRIAANAGWLSHA